MSELQSNVTVVLRKEIRTQADIGKSPHEDRGKMAVYEPRREARYISFPHSPQKEPTQ